MQLESNLKDDLYDWGYWAKECPSRSLGYPHSSMFSQMAGASISATRRITDDYALEIDKAIAFLFSGDPIAYSLIIAHFQFGISYRRIEEKTGVKKDRAKMIVDNSAHWLSGYLIAKKTNRAA